MNQSKLIKLIQKLITIFNKIADATCSYSSIVEYTVNTRQANTIQNLKKRLFVNINFLSSSLKMYISIKKYFGLINLIEFVKWKIFY